MVCVKTNKNLSDKYHAPERTVREVSTGGGGREEEERSCHKRYILVEFGSGYFTFYWLGGWEMSCERE